MTHLHFTPERLHMRVITLDPSGGVADDHTFTVRDKYRLKDEDREKAAEEFAKQLAERAEKAEKKDAAPIGSQ